MARDLNKRWKRFGEGLGLFIVLFAITYAMQMAAITLPQYYGIYTVLAAPLLAAAAVVFLRYTQDLPLFLTTAVIYAVVAGIASPLRLFTALIPAAVVLIVAGIVMARFDRKSGRADDTGAVGLDRGVAARKKEKDAAGVQSSAASDDMRGQLEDDGDGISPVPCAVVYAACGYPSALVMGLLLSSSYYTWDYVSGGTAQFIVILVIDVALSVAGALIAAVVVNRMMAKHQAKLVADAATADAATADADQAEATVKTNGKALTDEEQMARDYLEKRAAKEASSAGDEKTGDE